MNFKMPSTITTWLCAAVVTGTAALTSPDIAKAQGAKDFGGEELLVQTYGTLASYFRDNFAKEFNTAQRAGRD